MVVQDVMTANPITVDVADSLDWVESLLRELDVRHLPVLENGVLTGIISDRDLGPWRAEGGVKERVRAGQIMSGNLFTVHPEAELSDVVDTMLDQKVGALPVVDAGTNALVGIVSYIDILRAVRDDI
jgi:acetoin utilization protein AcuB